MNATPYAKPCSAVACQICNDSYILQGQVRQPCPAKEVSSAALANSMTVVPNVRRYSLEYRSG